MTIKEITVTFGGKLNLGDFNSAHIEMTVSALIEPNDSIEEASAQLLATAKAHVQNEARILFAKRGARVDQIFAGLPIEAQKEIGGVN